MATSSDPITLDPEGSDIQGEIARIRERGPVTMVVLPGGVPAWSVTGAAEVKRVCSRDDVSKDPQQHWPAWRNGEITENWPLANWVNTHSMFTAYGDEHRKLRAPVPPIFSAPRTAALEPRIQQIVDDLLDSLDSTPAGQMVDLREKFAYPLPVRVISELLGVPEEMGQSLRECVDVVFDTAVTPAKAMATHQKMIGLLQELVAFRRENPGDDMTSILIRAADNPEEAFTESDVVGTLYLTVNAGHETTVNLLDHAIHLLLTHSKYRVMVSEGKLTWEEVIEETLRFESPAAHLPLRYAVNDLDLGGMDIQRGDPIMVCYAAANRDRRVHGETADEFDPTRGTARAHIAFGHGVHRCPGAPLARLEALVALKRIFERFPDMELAPGEELGAVPGFVGNGHRRLPVLLSGT